MVTCTEAAICKEEDEDEKEERKEGEGREKGKNPPLGATVPGEEAEST